jgi:hypothetical protein
MRVFGAIMFVLGASLLLYGASILFSNGFTWRLGGLLAAVGFFLAWWGVNCLRDRRFR